MASVRRIECLKCSSFSANVLDIQFRYCACCHEYRPFSGVVIHEADDVDTPLNDGAHAPLPRIPTEELLAARTRLKRPSGAPPRKPTDKAPDPPETSTH